MFATGKFHFCCIGSIYRQLLQVTYQSWWQFWQMAIQSQVVKVALFGLQSQDWSSHLLGDQPARTDLRGKLAKFFNPDPLNQRGSLCFGSYLMITSDWIAALQFSIFVLVQTLLPYNAEVFINFSTEESGSFVPLQQLAFVCAGVAFSYARYCAIDVVGGRLFGITPTYVGTCHISQYPRFRRTMLVVSSHVCTDVYIGSESTPSLASAGPTTHTIPARVPTCVPANSPAADHSVIQLHCWSADGLGVLGLGRHLRMDRARGSRGHGGGVGRPWANGKPN